MCGLVGIFGKNLTPVQERVFKDLLYLDVFRGEHSTGAAVVCTPFLENQPETVEVVKEMGPAPLLFANHGKFQGKFGLTAKTGIKALIGHNRHATQGALSVDNAHPFEIGSVVGAHNGTVQKYYLKTLHEADKYEVDSQVIYSHLGAGHPISSVWEVADGAMALTWYNKDTKKLNLIRNKERPLYLSKSKDGKSLYWASEPWMIWIATSRNNVRDIEEPVSLAVDTLTEVSLDADGTLVLEETPVAPFVRKLVTTTYTGYRSGRSPWHGIDDDDWNTPSTKNRVIPLKPTLKVIIKEIVKDAWVPHAFGTTADGDTVRINFVKGTATTHINNIMQRRTSRGFYVTNKYSQLYVGGVNPLKHWVCSYTDLRYVKNNSLAEGYRGSLLTDAEYTALAKCGCINCKTIPSWKSREELRWIDADSFLCFECKELPWVKDLDRYGTE